MQRSFLSNRKLFLVVSVVIILSIPFSHLFGQSQPNQYRNKEHAFSIIFPKGWEIMKGATPNSVVKAVNVKGEDESIYIIVKILRKGLETFTYDKFSEKDLQDFVEGLISNYKQSHPDAILNDYGFTYLSNKRAIKYTITHSWKNIYGTAKLKQLMVETMHKGKQYHIGCGASPQDYKKYEKTFLTTISTFILEDKAWYDQGK